MKIRRSLGALGVATIVLAGAGSASVDSARGLIADGELGEALEALESIGREDVESRFLRGVVLAEMDRNDEAERIFRDLMQDYPAYPEPFNNLAVLLAESGRYDEAVETLKGALRTHASYRTAWDNLTTIYGRLASEAYSRALNVDSSAAEAPVELVLLSSLADVESTVISPVEAIPAVVVAEVETNEAVPAEPIAAPAVPVEPVAAPVEPVAAPAVPVEPVAAPAVPIEPVVEAEETDEAAEPEMVPTEASPGEISELVAAWAEAWSNQRVDDYLSFYSDTFEPADGTALEDWKSLRRSRLEGPEYIRVETVLIDFEIDGSEAEVTFNQSYESNTFSDVVTKSLSLSREGGAWKIVKETAAP